MTKCNRKKENWIGIKIGKFEIIDKIGEKDYKNDSRLYKTDILLCKCDCGLVEKRTARSFIYSKNPQCKGCNSRRLDLGKKIGNVTIIDWCRETSKGGRDYIVYNCKCDCGNLFKTKSYNIKNNKHDREYFCKKCTKSVNKINFKPTTISKYFTSIKQRVKYTKYDFTITEEYIQNIIEKQNFKCALSGKDISFINGTASLDRIDSSKGYVEGNVQWVYRLINFMKMELNQNDFINLCVDIANYHSIINSP